MGRLFFDPARVQRSAKSARARAVAVALCLFATALNCPCYAQPVSFGTAADYAVLGATTVTNTGISILIGNLGVSPGTAITGFPPGIVMAPGTTHAGDAAAAQAQIDATTAYNALAALPTTTTLTGQNLSGLTLPPGVYFFSSSAALTGNLTLNAGGNLNAYFVFNIGSTLTTASGSTVTVIGGGQGTNVFWRVGSSATLGTNTSFIGSIVALASITLNTGASISCGGAYALTGAVTLDTNRISIGNLAPCTTPVIPPIVVPPIITPVVTIIDTAFVNTGGALPPAFLDLALLPPAALTNALMQLSGEAGTGAALAGAEAMTAFLALVTNPFADSRGAPPDRPLPPRSPLVYKAPAYMAAGAAAPESRHWSNWAAAYGGQSNTGGDSQIGTHDRSMRTFGYATGLDYRITSSTVVGFALGGGSTNYGLSNGLGGGHSDMVQAAVYSLTSYNAAYLSTAVAYAWHRVTTDRYLTVAGVDHLTAGFSANNIGGRIEAGYRFAIPGAFGLPGIGFTPYAAWQAQVFRAPSYSERAESGSAVFALDYAAQTTTMNRTEIGAWFDRTLAISQDAILALRARAGWAHDHWSDWSNSVAFRSLPGSSFTIFGAAPARDSVLASAITELSFRNGISLAARFDSECARGSQYYAGTARLSYAW